MDDQLKQHAEDCRAQALSYLGRPEATFLLRAAREFDRLAREKSKAACHGAHTAAHVKGTFGVRY